MTSEVYQMSLFEDSENESGGAFNCSLEDFLARASQSLENVKDFRTLLEEHYTLKSLGSHLFSDLNIFFLRTSKDFSPMIAEKLSKPSSGRWMSWGMTQNGKCITARPTFHKIENGYSLSDILEDLVPEKYFLSDEKTEALLMSLDISRKDIDKSTKSLEQTESAHVSELSKGGGLEPKILDDQGRTTKRNTLLDIAPTLRAQSHGNEPKVVVAGHLECDSGGTGKIYDPEGIAPTQLAQHGNAVTKVVVIGNTHPSGNGMNGQVFDVDGLAPTLTTNKGEGNKILVNVSQITGVVETDESLCLDANYFKGLGANQARTGVMEPRAVLTPDRLEKRQNGRRMKEPGEPMFTLTAQDLNGVALPNDRIAGWVDREDKLFAYRDDAKRSTVQEHVYIKPEGTTDALTVGHTPKTIIDTKNMSADKKSGKSGVRIYEDVCPTLTATDYKDPKQVIDGYRIRKLTPLECFRLQSYPDWWYVQLKLFRHPELIDQVDMTRNDITEQVIAIIQECAIKEGISDSQLYKMAGNGVTSAVAEDIANRFEEVTS